MDSLSPETLEIFAGRIGWAGAEIWARQLPGDHFNRTDRVDLHLGGSERSLLVKRYAPYGGDRGKKASVEFQALSWLNASDVPVPEPVYLDQEGKLFGCPAIATGFVEGRPIYRPEGNQANWAADLARSLAAIHATPCGTQADEFLLDANRETTWFLNGGRCLGLWKKIRMESGFGERSLTWLSGWIQVTPGWCTLITGQATCCGTGGVSPR